jgi:hypothetical protein
MNMRAMSVLMAVLLSLVPACSAAYGQGDFGGDTGGFSPGLDSGSTPSHGFDPGGIFGPGDLIMEPDIEANFDPTIEIPSIGMPDLPDLPDFPDVVSGDLFHQAAPGSLENVQSTGDTVVSFPYLLFGPSLEAATVTIPVAPNRSLGDVASDVVVETAAPTPPGEEALKAWIKASWNKAKTPAGTFVGKFDPDVLLDRPAIRGLVIAPSEVFRDSRVEWDRFEVVLAFDPGQGTGMGTVWLSIENYFVANRGLIPWFRDGQPSPDWKSFVGLLDTDQSNGRMKEIAGRLKEAALAEFGKQVAMLFTGSPTSLAFILGEGASLPP